MINVEEDGTPVEWNARVYGASELGVLSLTAPGDVHPRVEYTGGELFVGLDAGDGAAVTRRQAESWSQPFPAVVAEVLASAPRISPAVNGVSVINDERSLAAVMIDPSRASDAAVDGKAVFFVLSRGQGVIVDGDDEAAMAKVLDAAEELYEAGGPLVSAHPLVVDDGEWAPFDWIGNFPSLAGRIHRVLRLFSVRAYERQADVLNRPDIHVAEPKLHVREDGVTLTFAAWPKGTATLLPVVDNVVIADPNGTISTATLDEFLQAAGDAVTRTGLSPARFFVPGDAPRQ